MRIKSFVLSALMAFSCIMPSMAAQVKAPKDIPWYDNKFSMFIHFGLYSQLGGVWNGKEVHYGYSEQIQSHGGIYGDLYAQVARGFNPELFDADSIVALAKDAGMKSIVITSKHHDGFCLFRTKTTDFNSYDSTPCHRDFIAELSEACHRGGIGFGLYFSLIDWHAPCAAPISSTNADFIEPLHHELNMAQVTELVTNYGPISELWFDMGSLTPEQSKDLYDLVRDHQPDCMVSGRLGHGCYDFAVMSDNYYPESSVQTPWQSAASMFDETWGYRSWQERGEPAAKAREKLSSLIRVTSGGGNFLLNIGPEGDGSIVPFESEVLRMMGSWLKENGDAIYSTKPSPYRTPFDWGCITRTGKTMNLILSGDQTPNIILPLPGNASDYRIRSVSGPAKATIRRMRGSRNMPAVGQVEMSLDDSAYEGDIKVVRITFNKEVESEESIVTDVRVAQSSYFCHDYYTNARSEVAYSWNMTPAADLDVLTFSYAKSDVGKKVAVEVDGASYEIVLGEGSQSECGLAQVKEHDRYVTHIPKRYFDSPQHYDFKLSTITDGYRNAQWNLTSTDVDSQTFDAYPFETVYVMEEVDSPEDQDVIFEVGAGNGVQVYVNGESILKHHNPYRTTFRKELVRVSLRKGANQIVLRSYNRFEKTLPWMLKVAEEQVLCSETLKLPVPLKAGKIHNVTIRPADAISPHQDCELHNLQLETR